MIKVAISESAPLFRRSLIELLNTEYQNSPRYHIVLETASNEELFEALLKNIVTPDIVIVDLNIHNMNDILIVTELSKTFPTIPIIVFSDLTHKNAILNILHAGAVSHLSKYSNSESILETIKKVHHQYYSSNKYRSEMSELKSSSKKFTKVAGYVLSNREIHFLKLCSSELTYKEIAGKMNVSFSTVCNYREALFNKLSIRSRVGLVLFSINSLLFNPFLDL